MNPVFVSDDPYTARLLESLGERVLAGNQLQAVPHFVIFDFSGGNSAAEVRRWREAGAVTLLLDDKGPARQEATLVSDAFMTEELARDYSHAVGTRYLYGFAYTPLKATFRQIRESGQSAISSSRLLISFGGGDCLRETLDYAAALHSQGFRGPATVIAGGPADAVDPLGEIVAQWRDSRLLPFAGDMAALMADSALVSTKLGVTLLEAFCLGVGCVLIEPTPAHYQLQLHHARIQQQWPVVDFGLVGQVDFDAAATRTLELLHDPVALQRWGAEGKRLVDGKGCARLIDRMLAAA